MDVIKTIKAGLFGVVVGDALGVPVEFTSRSERDSDPVTDMREYGTHSQPIGTWSDDSSMMLATLDSIIKCDGVDYGNIMEKFGEWKFEGKYTPHGRVFDIGITCSKAISMYRPGRNNPLDCGGNTEYDNGNGSLMRIMPASLLFAMAENYWNNIDKAVETVQNISRLTHGHPRSLIGCILYTSICHELIFRGERNVATAVQEAVDKTFKYYQTVDSKDWYDNEFKIELEKNVYQRLRNVSMFKSLPRRGIKSSGYVVDTLEAAVWCLLNTDSYKECALAAVNLGEDTDTVGAVAGGLAGLLYGFDGIPDEWLNVIVAKAWIEGMCKDFSKMVD